MSHTVGKCSPCVSIKLCRQMGAAQFWEKIISVCQMHSNIFGYFHMSIEKVLWTKSFIETENPEFWLWASYSLIARAGWSVEVIEMQMNLVKNCVYVGWGRCWGDWLWIFERAIFSVTFCSTQEKVYCVAVDTQSIMCI